ncbi:hypothetical protein [Facklamia sp. P12955]|uniref:hypothetical protein n=1 Tax=Facklamia sp. P12955 TaxID=3421946 RepID=UPI003D185FEA
MKKTDRVINILVKIMMFISSYFPLYIMLVILYFSKIKTGIENKNVFWIVFTVALILMAVISLLSILLLKLGKGTRTVEIKELERPDDTVLSYIMTYIIPLIANDGSSKEVYIVNVLLFILIGYIYLRLNLVYLNPLWAMFGYIIYRGANKEIVVTNIPRESLRNKELLNGYYLSNDIFIAHKKHNIE